jgi:hypothetical protein
MFKPFFSIFSRENERFVKLTGPFTGVSAYVLNCEAWFQSADCNFVEQNEHTVIRRFVNCLPQEVAWNS